MEKNLLLISKSRGDNYLSIRHQHSSIRAIPLYNDHGYTPAETVIRNDKISDFFGNSDKVIFSHKANFLREKYSFHMNSYNYVDIDYDYHRGNIRLFFFLAGSSPNIDRVNLVKLSKHRLKVSDLSVLIHKKFSQIMPYNHVTKTLKDPLKDVQIYNFAETYAYYV